MFIIGTRDIFSEHAIWDQCVYFVFPRIRRTVIADIFVYHAFLEKGEARCKMLRSVLLLAWGWFRILSRDTFLFEFHPNNWRPASTTSFANLFGQKRSSMSVSWFLRCWYYWWFLQKTIVSCFGVVQTGRLADGDVLRLMLSSRENHGWNRAELDIGQYCQQKIHVHN